MAIKEIAYVSKNMIRSMRPKADWAVISIADPGDSFNPPDGWHSVLALRFHDVKHVIPQCIAFCYNDAEKVINFVKKIENEINGIIIHCEAGVSRSGAIAYFLAEMYNFVFVTAGYEQEALGSNLHINSRVLMCLRRALQDVNQKN